MIFHLGFDKPNKIKINWYKDVNNTEVKAILDILNQITSWESLATLQFLIADGDDPMLSLKVTLDRENINQDFSVNNWQTQTVYIYQK